MGEFTHQAVGRRQSSKSSTLNLVRKQQASNPCYPRVQEVDFDCLGEVTTPLKTYFENLLSKIVHLANLTETLILIADVGIPPLFVARWKEDGFAGTRPDLSCARSVPPRTPCGDVATSIRRQLVDEVILFGHSPGGWIASLAAAEQ